MESNYVQYYIKLSWYIRLYLKLYKNLSFARLLVPRAYPRVVDMTICGVIEKVQLRRW